MNPNTGRANGAAQHQVVAEQAVYVDAGRLFLYRPAGHPASASGCIEWRQSSRWQTRLSTPPTRTCSAHRVACEAFRIGRTPVTNADYRRFVEATGHPPAVRHRDLHPVTYVCSTRLRFCRGRGFLPTEAQWERAARGGDARTLPLRGRRLPSAPCRRPRHGSPRGRPVPARFGSLDLARGTCGNGRRARCGPIRTRPREAARRPLPSRASCAAIMVPEDPLLVPARDAARCGRSLRRAASLGAADPLALGLEMVDVPAGKALLGNDRGSRAGRHAAPTRCLVTSSPSCSPRRR